MQYREIGASGLHASTVALGTWAIGGGSWWGESDDVLSINAIQAGIDHGITLIDTAPMYGWGHSEQVVGRALKGRRDKVILATKCGMWFQDARGSFWFNLEGRAVNRSLRPDTIREEIDQSLHRLDTDYIDLYQTHWPAMAPEMTPIAETMGCLLELQQAGKIRAIGVSNASPAQMDEYRAVGALVSDQPRFSMLTRDIEHDVIPYALANHLSLLVYSPLEQGLLTGKLGMDYVVPPGSWRNNIPWFQPHNRQRILDLLAGWNDLTDKYACTISQLVIAWTIQQPGITAALCGARRPEQAIENAGAGRVTIAVNDLARMRHDLDVLGEPR
jgi:methylglyoxal reductase